jgi:succinylglutamic semialdehyde dehydrogenase
MAISAMPPKLSTQLEGKGHPMDLKTLVDWFGSAKAPVSWPGNWVGRKFVKPTGENKVSVNPSNDRQLVTIQSSRDALHHAIQLLDERRTSSPIPTLETRLEGLKRLRCGLADIQHAVIAALQLEAGKPKWEAEEDFRNCIEYLDWISASGEEVADRALAIAKSVPGSAGQFVLRPLGTVCAYLPFSTSLTTFVHYYTACCLAGCPVVIVPSSHTILIGMLLAAIDQEVDFADGWLSIVFGSFQTFRTAISSKHSTAMLYTGSREHCEWIRKENRVHGQNQELILQSGGKNSLIVMESADLDVAVRGVFFSAFKSMGQLCSSASRLFVHRSVSKEFFQKLASLVNGANIGPTDNLNDEGPLLGPLYSQKAAEKFFRYQTMGRRETKEEICRGQSILAAETACFVSPAVMLLRQFDAVSAFQQNVLYSPILASYEFDDVQQAVNFTNMTDAPYAVSVFGQENLDHIASSLDAPNIFHNLPTVELECTLPMAGWKSCGNHRYGAAAIMLYLSRPQFIRTQDASMNAFQKWPLIKAP